MVSLRAGSTLSSGIGSGCDTPELGWSGGEEEERGGRLQELALETDRLNSMVGVLEEREEQLLGQVEVQGAARRRAEERAVAAEGRAEVGRRMKSALLLTAAFGAAHTALRSDLALECLPM